MIRTKIIKTLCLSALLCVMAFAKENFSDENISEEYIQQMLSPLINGTNCENLITHQSALYSVNIISIGANSTLDAKRLDLKKNLSFQGQILRGGIYDEKEQAFISDDRRFSYTMKNNTLQVKSICEKQSFTLNNFNNNDFGINLSKNAGKELALAINTNNSMDKYVFALKEIAPYLAKHIFKDKKYTKVSILTFTYLDIDDLGTFYNENDFINAFKNIQGSKSQTRMLNLALIRSMSNFTKDNKLLKEIYLFSDAMPSDMQNTQKVLSLVKNLNANTAYNAKVNIDNFVKIHSFALKPNLAYLKDLATATNGVYNEANNVYDFKKQILTLSNDGKAFDMSELDNEIRPSKTNKIYDDKNDDKDKPDGK